jgi:microcin C transport system ATP-binding protein
VNASETQWLTAEGVRLRKIGSAPIHLSVGRGERIGLLAGAGSGKRQLLRTLARLEGAAAGRIRWNGIDVTHTPRWLMSRAQREGVLMIWENPYVLFGQNRPVRTIVGSGAKLVEAGLTPAALDLEVSALSGLARVRLALAYTAKRRPRVLLVDDVFHHLAPAVWQEVVSVLGRILPRETAMILASRHASALERMERVVVLSDGDIVENGFTSEHLARS